eukprot:CAMPEP_0195322596 /NCGR_PEP_ID=MMETSP0708-20121125/7414_1 /TAXON_ID=33640 /ORGANISM="Asterionellopsis glacialis, Strain CCMP134" /LENGTH=42 /DNA_ID= /DNA_START= /DNA_END= /DNA_ORIENTATION=
MDAKSSVEGVIESVMGSPDAQQYGVHGQMHYASGPPSLRCQG